MTTKTDLPPLPERFDCTNGSAQWCYGCYTMTRDDLGDYVLAEDYDALRNVSEALQAEVEALRAEVERLAEALECMIIGACAVAVPHNGERAVLQDAVNIARAALAAYRKGGKQ